MLSEAERAKVLVSWNAHRRAAARARVDQGAVRGAGRAHARTRRRSSFGERAADLRRAQPAREPDRLRCCARTASGPGTLVGVLMEKSLDLVPAVLGVVKAGGAYIPLDPMYPPTGSSSWSPTRSRRVLLTQEKHLRPRARDAMPRTHRRRRAGRARRPDRGRTRRRIAGGDDLAYVIYTSGSTGKPKGAMIANRSLASAYFAYERAYRLRELTRPRPDGELLLRRVHRRHDPLAAGRREARAVPDRDRRRPAGAATS